MEKKSVSATVVEELCSQELKKNVYFPFFSGVLRGCGELIFTREGFSIDVKHTNGLLIRILQKIIKEVYGIALDSDYTDMNLGYKHDFFYTMIIPAIPAGDLLERCCIVHNKYEFVTNIPKKFLGSNAAKKAYLQGLFLSCGFLKTPQESDDVSQKSQSGYTLSFNLNSNLVKEEIISLITTEAYLADDAVRQKKSGSGIYIKSSEAICDVLTYIGSVKGALMLHNIISTRKMRNDINRVTNFDLANIDKAVVAGAKQTDAITRLKQSGVYDKLSPIMKLTCDMRQLYPDMGLEELGKEFDPPISKSCINHRLRKIMELAENLED